MNKQRLAIIPGGVNSPVRAFKAVGEPKKKIIIKKARGPYLITTSNNKLIDYVNSWGSIITGHANAKVTKDLTTAINNGLGFGLSHDKEEKFAQVITKRSNTQMIRMVNSGTEATMTAIRLARAITKRNLIIKFNGAYHGHSDALLVAAGSGSLSLSIPTSLGVPNNVVKDTLVLEFNDVAQLNLVFKKHASKIAAVIFEPICGNMNFVKANPKFIKRLVTLAKKNNTLLIADEVMTGFRASYGLVSNELYKIDPDLVCLGKVIGGGLPAAAIAGKRKYLSNLAPTGKVYQAGTLSGNPLAIAAGLSSIAQINQTKFKQLSNNTKTLCEGLVKIAKQNNISLVTNYQGAMAGIFFNSKLPQNLNEVNTSNQEIFKRFFHLMLAENILFPPSMYEAFFLSQAHDKKIIAQTLAAAKRVFKKLNKEFN